MTKVKAWMRYLKIRWAHPKTERIFSQIDDFEEIDFDHRPFINKEE